MVTVVPDEILENLVFFVMRNKNRGERPLLFFPFNTSDMYNCL